MVRLDQGIEIDNIRCIISVVSDISIISDQYYAVYRILGA